jgi:hypothetical protein
MTRSSFRIYTEYLLSSLLFTVANPFGLFQSTVSQGQFIGNCGHSGHSTEPHVHLQFQDHPSFHLSRGLPIRFAAFERRHAGEPTTEICREGYINRGHEVRRLAVARDDGVVDDSVTAAVGSGDLLKSLVGVLLTVVGLLYLGRLVLRVFGLPF